MTAEAELGDALRTLPVELLLAGRRAVCLGACAEVAWKVERLIRACADVVVIEGGAIHPVIAEHVAAGDIRHEARAPRDEDADGAAIVFVSPDHEALGRRLADRARDVGRLVCTLDRPHACTFVNPAVARGPQLTMTLASGGRSPALLRRLREDLERALGDARLGAFVDRITALRRNAGPGGRAAVGRAAVLGFTAELTFRFPRWFEEGAPGPEPDDWNEGKGGT